MTVPSTDRQTSVMEHIASLLRIFSSREQLALTAVLLLHLALVIPLAATLNIWVDEAFTLGSTDGGIVHAFRRALNFELQPPLYFILLTLWRTLDDSLFFARFFSILCTASTVVLAGSLARRYLPGVRPALVAAVVAFNPLTVYTAVDARFYAMTLVLSALLLLFFHDGYVATEPSQTARRRYTAVAVTALYTHYFLGFLLAAGGAALLLFRCAVVRPYLVGMMATAILFAPLALMTVRQIESVEATVVQTQTLAEGTKLVWSTGWRYILPVNQENPLAKVRGWVARLLLPLALLAALVRRQRPTPVVLVLLTIAATVSLFFVGVSVRLGPDFMHFQHATVLYLPILLAALALLQYVGGVRAAATGALASVVFSAPYLMETYAPLAKGGDWIRVSRYIERHESTSEPILVFRSVFALDFGYHYAGRNQIIPLPRPIGEERFDLKDQVLWDESEILQALSGQLDSTRRFWLVTSHTVLFRGIDIHYEILESFVARHCNILHDKSFRGSRVRLLKLRLEDRKPNEARGRETEIQQVLVHQLEERDSPTEEQ